MKTIRMRNKSSLASILHTDMMNAVNQRRISTPQQSNRLCVSYEEQQRFRSLSVCTIPTIKLTKNQHLLKRNSYQKNLLDVQPTNYHGKYRHSCTSQTNCGALTPSPTILNR
jgi:hypothetical protein